MLWQKSVSPKKLSFISIYFLGINGVIGSGAFLLPQTIYKDMNLMSILVLICAALTVGMVALCYADLSSHFTGSGAAWLYSYNAFGRFAGYELGICTWFLGCCTYAAEVVALLTTLFNMINNDAPTKTNFAEQAKDRMLAYSQTPEWREYEMYIDAVLDENTKKVTKEVTRDAITKLVTVLKSDGMDEAVVLNILVKTYGDKYSEGELKKFIDEAK